MIQLTTFFEDAYKTIFKNKILSIAGPSTTGKTTLALQLISTFLTDFDSYQNGCLWIQASELFPKKRIQNMLKFSPGKLDFVLNNIFIIPSNQVCKNYEIQKKLIYNITENNVSLPSHIKYIVIDNISHHLRYEVSKCNDIHSYKSISNDFFYSQLYPLIMWCNHNEIALLLIHEVSYDPKLGKNKVFCQSLYERISGVNIFLDLNEKMKYKTLTINFEKKLFSFEYLINDQGLKLISSKSID